MNIVLIDTSVWIEFFSKRSKISNETIASLKELISNGDAVIMEPIRAEILSGHILSQLRNEILSALDVLDMIDLDWNSRNTWDDIVALADIARSHQLPIPGIVDRMILIAALNANVQIASLDQTLMALARAMKVNTWESNG
jgi:predicted nucleic acid-binding protein